MNNKLNKTQLLGMLEMQDAMNSKINLRWLSAGYPFMRAVAVEGVEALEHAGWKWWKAQAPDTQQLRMELVDIWHFALSDALVGCNGEAWDAAEIITDDLNNPGMPVVYFDGCDYFPVDMDLKSKLELLIGLAVADRFDVALFESILESCGMSWGVLYASYLGKNALNFFRQDHGYKDGSYQKAWGGREDNEHLTEILALSDITAPPADILGHVYLALAARYAEHTGVERVA